MGLSNWPRLLEIKTQDCVLRPLFLLVQCSGSLEEWVLWELGERAPWQCLSVLDSFLVPWSQGSCVLHWTSAGRVGWNASLSLFACVLCLALPALFSSLKWGDLVKQTEEPAVAWWSFSSSPDHRLLCGSSVAFLGVFRGFVWSLASCPQQLLLVHPAQAQGLTHVVTAALLQDWTSAEDFGQQEKNWYSHSVQEDNAVLFSVLRVKWKMISSFRLVELQY